MAQVLWEMIDPYPSAFGKGKAGIANLVDRRKSDVL